MWHTSTNALRSVLRIDGGAEKTVDFTAWHGFTCIDDGMLGKSDTAGLGQESAHGDALGLQLLVKSVQGIGGDSVGHTELRNLQTNKDFTLLAFQDRQKADP